MVTIKDIARECNVSIATVSNVINEKKNVGEATRQLVLDTIDRLEYTPNVVAKNLKIKKNKTIGIVVEDITVFCAPGIIDGLTKCSEENGYDIVFTNLRLYEKFGDSYYDNTSYHEIVEKQIKALTGKQVSGIVYVTSHERVVDCVPHNINIPVVMAYGYTESDRFTSVTVDDEYGAYKLTKYIIGKGHRNIGVITGKSSSLHSKRRLAGYKRALKEFGIRYDDQLVVEGDWTMRGGYDNSDKLLDMGVTAIFCMNDIMAGGVYNRIEEEGLVPGEDISIVGYDNREMATYFTPSLTTMSMPLQDIGYAAGVQIIHEIEESTGEHESHFGKESASLAENGHDLTTGKIIEAVENRQKALENIIVKKGGRISVKGKLVIRNSVREI